LVVAFIGVDAALGGDEDAVHVAIVGGVIEAGGTAEDVDGVVVAAEQAVGAEAGDLLFGMAFDGAGKSNFEAAPGFAFDLNGRDFLGGETVLRVKERGVEVGPEGFADEIGNMDFVPRSLSLLAFEGFFGVIA
jgi:hypothetical protein